MPKRKVSMRTVFNKTVFTKKKSTQTKLKNYLKKTLNKNRLNKTLSRKAKSIKYLVMTVAITSLLGCAQLNTPTSSHTIKNSIKSNDIFNPKINYERKASEHLFDKTRRFDLQAHRGGLGLVVESSIASFTNGLNVGVTTLEMDAQITKDGIAVVTHDRKVSDKKCLDTQPVEKGDPLFPYIGKYINQLTLAQVKTLDCGSLRLQAYPHQRLVPGSQIPTLKEVFELVHHYKAYDVLLNIETKVEAGAPEETAPREVFVDTVLNEVRHSGLMNQITIQSFDWGALMLVREKEPTLPIVALTNGQQFLQIGEESKSPWLGGIDMDDFNGDLITAVKSFRADAISPVHGNPQNGRINDKDYVPFTTPALVQSAHSANIKVIPWTVSDYATIDHLVGIGVDGIITDLPDVARLVLTSRNMQLPIRIKSE